MNGADHKNHFRTRPEVEFLLCLSRTHLDPENHQRAHELLEQPLDWDYLCNTAFWHGTSQLMDRHLTREFAGAVPAEAAAKIREFCDHNVERSLTLARELAAVMTIFQSKGIRALAYKGPCLAKAAYGDLTLRAFGDLDILVFHPDVPVCAQIFRDRGYVLGEHTAVTTTGSEGRIRHEQRFLLHRPSSPSSFNGRSANADISPAAPPRISGPDTRSFPSKASIFPRSPCRTFSPSSVFTARNISGVN
jgi:hypothetical protein